MIPEYDFVRYAIRKGRAYRLVGVAVEMNAIVALASLARHVMLNVRFIVHGHVITYIPYMQLYPQKKFRPCCAERCSHKGLQVLTNVGFVSGWMSHKRLFSFPSRFISDSRAGKALTTLLDHKLPASWTQLGVIRLSAFRWRHFSIWNVLRKLQNRRELLTTVAEPNTYYMLIYPASF